MSDPLADDPFRDRRLDAAEAAFRELSARLAWRPAGMDVARRLGWGNSKTNLVLRVLVAAGRIPPPTRGRPMTGVGMAVVVAEAARAGQARRRAGPGEVAARRERVRAAAAAIVAETGRRATATAVAARLGEVGAQTAANDMARLRKAGRLPDPSAVDFRVARPPARPARVPASPRPNVAADGHACLTPGRRRGRTPEPIIAGRSRRQTAPEAPRGYHLRAARTKRWTPEDEAYYRSWHDGSDVGRRLAMLCGTPAPLLTPPSHRPRGESPCRSSS